MRFATAQPPLFDIAATVELAQEAEVLGFATVWIADQTFFGDPWVILAAAAQATSQIRLGLGLTNPQTRHPTVTARAAVAMGAVSSGRFDLGLGSGNTKELLTPLGLLSPKPAKSLAEMVEIVISLLQEGRVDHDGEFFQAREIELEATLGDAIPVFVGGRGEQILRLAGRKADGVVLGIAGYTKTWEIVSEAASIVGRSPRSIKRVAWGECIVDPTPEELEEQRHIVGHVLGRAPIPGLMVLGLDPDLIATLKRAYEEDGIAGAARHVSDDLMKRHIVIGSLDECLERLRRFADDGVDEFALLTKKKTLAERRQLLHDLSARVLPEFA
jgi:5,10-methylenetetrahydromethanopterin reductase